MPTSSRTMLISVALVALATACGSSDESAGGAQQASLDTVPAAEATVTETLPTSVPASTAPASTEPVDPECENERKTLEVAVEAYRAQYGTYPATETELVDVGMLRSEIAAYDVVSDGGDVVDVVRAPGVACAAPVDEPADEDINDAIDDAMPQTADEYYELFGPELVESVGGPECGRELAEIAAAFARYLTREGREPVSSEELEAELAVELTLWDADFDAETLLPAPGSPCITLDDPDSMTSDDVTSLCDTSAKTLAVALEAYAAMNGFGATPTEAELVTAEFLRDELELVDIVDGVVVAAPGTGCEGVLAPAG